MENTKSWVQKNFKRIDDGEIKKVPPPNAITTRDLKQFSIGFSDDNGTKKLVIRGDDGFYEVTLTKVS